MSEAIEKKAQEIENKLENEGGAAALEALKNETKDMSPQDKKALLDSLQKRNDESPIGTPKMTMQSDDQGNVNVEFKNNPGAALAGGIAHMAVKLFGLSAEGAGKANEAVAPEKKKE